VADSATCRHMDGGSMVDRVRRGVHRSTVDQAERVGRGAGGERRAERRSSRWRHGCEAGARHCGEPGHGGARQGHRRIVRGAVGAKRALATVGEGRGVLLARRRRRRAPVRPCGAKEGREGVLSARARSSQDGRPRAQLTLA
jgi:hypothetical protein